MAKTKTPKQGDEILEDPTVPVITDPQAMEDVMKDSVPATDFQVSDPDPTEAAMDDEGAPPAPPAGGPETVYALTENGLELFTKDSVRDGREREIYDLHGNRWEHCADDPTSGDWIYRKS